MGPNARLMQKERLESPQKSPILENQAIWVILAILAKTAILVILASHFRTRVDAPNKILLRVLLVSTRPSYFLFLSELDPPEAKQNFLLPGLSPGGDLGSRLSGGLHGGKRGFGFVSLI